ncbi:Cytoplasmic glyoxalase II [Parahypoxylon ruwenzoriense]
MVQYIHTPWRDRAELLKVRQQFYPSPPPITITTTTTTATATATATGGDNSPIGSLQERCSEQKFLFSGDGGDDDDGEAGAEVRAGEGTWAEMEEAAQQYAVSRVAMWMQRGGCPHLVESTALLMAAVLSDVRETRARANSSSYALRAAYSAAFSRFVTGLLDSQQDKQRKMSMYSVAKTVGLPATFVELRHQATHEQLPSLSKLRTAARKALAWIWDYYWKNLPGEDSKGNGEEKKSDAYRDLLLRYLKEEPTGQTKALRKQLKRWDEVTLLRNLAEVGDSSQDPKVITRSLRLSQAILDGDEKMDTDGSPSTLRDLSAIRADIEASSTELETTEAAVAPQAVEKPVRTSSQGKGWSKYEGPWTPKPIGVV